MPRPLLGLALLFCLASPVLADAPLPSPLAPFADLLRSAQLYHNLLTGGRWETICDDRFTDPADNQWRQNTPAVNSMWVNTGDSQNAAAPSVSVVDGAPALVLHSGQWNLAQVAVGPPVRCDMAVEMVARQIDNAAGALAVNFDGVETGPGFCFGCQENTQSQLWVPRPPQPGGQVPLRFPFPVDLGSRIVPGQSWSRIRLEVRGDLLLASVNGQLLGSARMPAVADFAGDLHQANIFAMHGDIAVRRVIVGHYAVIKFPMPPDKAWSIAFGSASRQAVGKRVESLIQLMGDADPQVRDGAQKMLTELPDIAAAQLRVAAVGDETEIACRAGWIIASLNPAPAKIPPLPPQIERFRFGGWMFGPNAQAIADEFFFQYMMNGDNENRL